MVNELLLSELEPGQTATIVKFTTEDIFLKLMEMGCLPGERIEVVQKALFNDPMSVSVAGYLLSLRTDEARHIVVTFATN
ncbi:MAG TPA: FeoA family protein [Niabella sp.]|nr:FeoA family protein [Niabella sp.]HOZ96450.1 FeoA family protein [Niabella sp.]HQW13369.1 FeoA family protein [Niabella sp.]HQX18591.1 FeoA family protein [Niabella sp.]HRB06488.1 FeoA family protein [Niabella sp.]